MFWYLSTPYTKYPAGIANAFEEASRQTALLVRAGIPVFCPIAHFHPIAIHGDIDPRDHSIWLPANEPFMRAARGLIVCKMFTWDTSYGVGKEIEFFAGTTKPIVMMTPGEVPEGVV